MKPTFKKFLAENHYGSLVDQDTYASLDKADKALYKYTADGFTDLSTVFDSLKKKYKFEGGVLYRGLHFSGQDQYDAFMAEVETGEIKIPGPSSWTPDKGTAEDFAHSKKSYFPTPELMYASEHMRSTGDHMTGYGGVVLKVKAEAGTGVDVRKSDFVKESEVILEAGTYKVTVEKLVEPYKRKYDSIEKIDSIIAQMKKAKERTPELNKLAQYVEKSWVKKLNPEQMDVLMKYELGKFFTVSPEELKNECIHFEISKEFFKGDNHRLQLRIFSGGVNPDYLAKCTEKMQAFIKKRVKVVVTKLKETIQEIMKHPEIDKVTSFYINGVDQLKDYWPSETEAAVAPLRKLLGDRYHKLNSRDYLKKIQDRDDMKAYSDNIEQVLKAITSL